MCEGNLNLSKSQVKEYNANSSLIWKALTHYCCSF